MEVNKTFKKIESTVVMLIDEETDIRPPSISKIKETTTACKTTNDLTLFPQIRCSDEVKKYPQ